VASCDFSTTTSTQLISSQITLMKSMQKYFDYEMMMCGCGIPAIEMRGSEEDWSNLQKKLKTLKTLLEPVEKVLHLKTFFGIAEGVYKHLLGTYKDGSSERKWWQDVLLEGMEKKRVGGGGSMPGKIVEVDAYDGWIIEFITGSPKRKLYKEDLTSGKYSKELSGVSSCPMRIVDVLHNLRDDSILIAGILGFKVYEDSQNGIATLEPSHGWVMLLPSNSPLRKTSTA